MYNMISSACLCSGVVFTGVYVWLLLIHLSSCGCLCLHVNLSKCHLAIVLPGSKRTGDKRDKVLSECVFIRRRVNEVSSGWCKQAGVTLSLCRGLGWQTLTLSRTGSLRTQSMAEAKRPPCFQQVTDLLVTDLLQTGELFQRLQEATHFFCWFSNIRTV